MPTLTQLEYLVAVDRTRHFGRAARACHVSQPTLSAQVHKLEEELGVVVFDRKHKPVVPTPAGVAVLERAREVLRAHERLVHVADELAGDLAGPLSLAVIPTLAPYLLPRFLAAFARAHPRIELTVEERRTEDIIAALRADQIDAGLLATPLGERGLRERPLFYEPFYVYAAAGHPLLSRDVVRDSQLDPADLWLLEDGHCLRTQVVHLCGAADGRCGRLDNVRFEAGTLESLRQLVRVGGGYTLVPHLLVVQLSARERARHVRPIARPVPTREVSLVFRRDLYKRDALRALYDAVRANVPDDLPARPRAAHRVVDAV